MVSVLNLATGLGMMAVAIVAIAYWYHKKRPRAIYFAYGALFWAVAIALKLIMDLTISKPLYAWLYSSMPTEAAMVAVGLYLGLRTGILENGVVYLGVKYSKLGEMSFNDAVAVGIGFGGTEALFLGALSLMAVIALLAYPNLMSLVPVATQEQFELIFAPLPVVERLFVLFGHVFATVLAIYAVKLSDLKWLGIAAVYKTLIDGSLPIFNHYLGYLGAYEYFPIDTYLAIMGLIGLAGLYAFSKEYGGAADARKAGDPDPGH